MTPRARVVLLVALAAAAAAAIAVAAASLTADERRGPQLRAGAPPLLLDLGVRDDPEARALRRAARLYDDGDRAAAGRIFARQLSLEARVGLALSDWPGRTLLRLEQIARARPRSAFVQLHLGLARYWLRRDDEALAAWRAAASSEPDSLSAVRASDLLHPDTPPGMPFFVPGFSGFRDLVGLSPADQLEALERDARRDGARARLQYGIALQRLGRPRSAEREFAAAAALDPNNVEAQVAAAVGRFDKARPERAFSRLGPLARRYPRSASVRFHLGLLLLWIGRPNEARKQLELARSRGGGSPLAREAGRILQRLEST